MNPQVPIEEQLRRYADAIDPAGVPVSVIEDDARPRRPRRQRPFAALCAAAAAVLVLVGVWMIQRDDQQQVETVASDPGLLDGAVPGTAASDPGATDTAGDPDAPPLVPLTTPTLTPDSQGLDRPASDPRPSDLYPTVLAYAIEPGDTLGVIAEKFETTADALLQANPGLDPSRLIVGQEIIIPVPPPATGANTVRAQIPMPGIGATSEIQLAISVAERVLLDECAAARGVTLDHPTEAEVIELHGSWGPGGVLGIGRAGAARSIGYHSAGWGGLGSPSQADAWHALSDEEQNAMGSVIRACWPDVYEQLGDDPARRAAISNSILGADETQGARFLSDPNLAGALADWRDCMAEQGIDAESPDELARRFAFEPELTYTERNIAELDVGCQFRTGLEEAFLSARAEVLLREHEDLFREWARLNHTREVNAHMVLADRGIELPSLD